MQVINQDIKNRSFKPVYLLYGEEAYLKNSYKKKIKEAVAGSDAMNVSTFSGKGLNLDELIRMADTMPFFSEKRLILVEESNLFHSSAGELTDYLPGMPDTTCLLFVESQVDRRSRLFKKVKELGHAAEMGRQSQSQLARWAAGILSRENKKITKSTMEVFLNKAGDDMEHIRMEIEKLVSYTAGSDMITTEDVETICTVRVINKVFDMVAAIVSRKAMEAMDLYEDLLTLKEPPMRILFLIARQFNQILQVKNLMEKGLNKQAVAARLKLQPFVAERLMTQARRFSYDQILSYVAFCVEMDEAVKSGRLRDRLAVELLITKEYYHAQ